MLRRNLMIGAVALAALFGAGSGMADEYPSEPVTLVVPYGAGGTSDIIARLLQPRLADALGQNILIVNVPGANGTIGTAQMVREPADGQTMLLASSATSGAPALFDNLPYDTLMDLAPVAQIGFTPYFLYARSGFAADDVAGLIETASAEPDSVTYASTGTGAFTHLAAELFAHETGTKLFHIPYNGTGQAVSDLAGGHVDILFTGLPAAKAFVDSGQIRILGAATLERSALKPDVPTISEQGVEGFEAGAWFGFMTVAGTPPEAIARFAEAVETALADPEVQKQLEVIGAVPLYRGPAAFGEFFARDVARSAELVEMSGAKSN